MRLVTKEGEAEPDRARFERLARHLDRLEALADELEGCAAHAEAEADAEAVRAAGIDCRRLISVIRTQIEKLNRPG